jgi:hypothetical protein
MTISQEHSPAGEEPPMAETPSQAANFSDLLQELRVLLQGVQVLTAFLIVLPFYAVFAQIPPPEKVVYLATFACSLTSLIIFSAPAAQHRLEWPLRNRAHFKQFATRMIIIGLVPLSFALVLVTQLIVAQILGIGYGIVAACLVAVLIGTVWWLLPLWWRRTI